MWSPGSKYQQPGPYSGCKSYCFMLGTVTDLTSVSKAVIYLQGLTGSAPPLNDVASFSWKASEGSDPPDMDTAMSSAVLFWEERPVYLCWEFALMFITESPYIRTIEFIVFLSSESKPASQEEVFHGKKLKCPHETIKCDPGAHKSLNYSVCSSQFVLFWGLIFLAPLQKITSLRIRS